VQIYVGTIFAASKVLVSWTDAGLLAAREIEVCLALLLLFETCKRAPASLIPPSETRGSTDEKPDIKQ